MSKELKFLLDATWSGAEKKFKQKIADLEAKLAESEKENKRLNREYNFLKNTDDFSLVYSELCNKINSLQEQLAEKDVEIKRLEECFNKVSGRCTWVQLKEIITRWDTSAKDFAIREMRNMLERVDQDKLNFAIAELEKVRNFVNYTHFDNVNDNLIERFEIDKKIDNQIKQLKEMK